MPPTPGALSARVSSDPQAEAQTIASHVAAWRERVTAAGWVWPAALPLLEAGDRGATLMRPALERLRAVIAGGAVDRGEGPSPERLARQYAAHVVLGDALRRAGWAAARCCAGRPLGTARARRMRAGDRPGTRSSPTQPG